MANCNFISSDYSLPCRDQMGGTVKFFVGQWSGATSYSLDSENVITGATSANTHFEFEQRTETAQLTETGNYGDNGTRFFEQSLSVALEKMSASLRNRLNLLGQSKLSVIAQDSNGVNWLIGKDEGAWVTESEHGTGQAKGDRNGLSLTFTARERFPLYKIADSALSDFTS